MDALENFVGSEGSILIVESITRAIRGGDVELHQMDVLTDDIGRRTHLEVVDLVDVRGQ